MHPFSFAHTRPNGGNSGAWNEVHAGDHVVYLIDGRKGILDECLHDGEALISWDDGGYGTVKWYHLAPSNKIKEFPDGRWEAIT